MVFTKPLGFSQEPRAFFCRSFHSLVFVGAELALETINTFKNFGKGFDPVGGGSVPDVKNNAICLTHSAPRDFSCSGASLKLSRHFFTSLKTAMKSPTPNPKLIFLDAPG